MFHTGTENQNNMSGVLSALSFVKLINTFQNIVPLFPLFINHSRKTGSCW